MESKDAPAAQDADNPTAGQVQDDAAGAPPPPAPAPAAPSPVADQTPELRNRLAAQGRELANTKSELVRMQQQLGTVVTSINEERRVAYLNSLPPEQRTQAEIDLLKQEIGQLRGGSAAAGQPQAVDPVVYQQQRSQQLLDWANGQVRGGAAITADDIPQYAWADETSFTTALRLLVDQRNANRPPAAQAQSTQEDAVPGKKSDAPDGGAVTLTQAEIQKIVEEGVTKALQGTGVGRPGGPRPAATVQNGEPPDFNQVVMDSRTNRNGSAGLRRSLAEARDRLGTGKGR